jgi:arginyl-tRNA synthetase
LDDKGVMADISQQALGMMLAKIKETVADDLNITMDVWTSEAALKEAGLVDDMMKKLRARKVTYKKDGAEYLQTTKFGDDQDRVLVKKDGDYAYIAPDIAYHQNKYDRKFDLIFTFLGADHQGHIPKVKAAMEALGNDVDKLRFPIAQWFSLTRGGKTVAMSKRKGNIYTPKELIDEVGYDAARWFFVSSKLDSHMEFNLDLAKEKSERNPVFYVQYAYVRLQSILRRAKEDGSITEQGMKFDTTSHPELTHTMEINLLRTMYRWPEVVASVATEFTVHQLAYYASDLAKAIHVFYKQVPVLKVEDETVKMARLQLVLAAQAVLGKVLDLLGISKPEVM